MEKKLYFILTMLCATLRVIYCKEDCNFKQKHIFEVKVGISFSFSAEIKELGGLVLDIKYEDRRNDRIKLSPKKSEKYMHNGKDHIKSELSSLINEGWHDINVFVGANTLNITCTTSQMSPVAVSIHSGIQSVMVSSENLKICEESCAIEKNVEKSVNGEENFNITVFTTAKHPITFKISNSEEFGSMANFEIKSSDCSYKWKRESRKIPCDYIKQGWNKLNVFHNRTTLAINNHILPISTNMKTINIHGTYLVNCKKGNPVWKIAKEEVPVPISVGQEMVFIITSTVTFSPVFNLEGIKLTLNWNDGLNFGVYKNSLQPNTYRIVFEATSEMLILYSEDKKDVLMEMKIDKAPEFIKVSSNKGEYRLTLSVDDPSQKPQNIIPVIEPSPDNSLKTTQTSTIDSSLPTPPLVIILSVLLSLMGIGILVFMIWKIFKTKMMQKDEIKKNESIPYEDQNYSSEASMVEKDALLTVRVDAQLSSSLLPNSRSEVRMNMDTQDAKHDIRAYDDKVEKKPTSVKKEIEIKNIDQGKCEDIDMRLKDFGKNKPVTQVMEELEHIIKSIFKTIRNKQLYGQESADTLLKHHGLPGTIRDIQGNSLLHYLIFPIQQGNQTHGVNADDIKKFLGDHKVFVNAANYKGETPLHALVLEASKRYSTEEWSDMAQLLVDIGCDPRVKDNNGQLPEDIALHRGCIYLQSLLRTSRINKGEIDMKSRINHWPKLIKGTYASDIKSVRQLLNENVPILPLSSTTDPLRVAIQKGNIELTMLLLSAGAPLCGRSLIGLNSLEVSHSTPGLSVFFPALIRREFYNCLKTESEMIIGKDCDLVQLKNSVIDLSEKVRKDGYKSVFWNFSSKSINRSERSKEARKMLRLASSTGMGLTCQMLGLEDVFLHPLPLEIAPDLDAKPNSLLILCRDLELSLSLKEGNIPPQLKEEYEEYNFKKLREFCEKKSFNYNSLYDKETPVNIEVLKYIAEQGLDITYKTISRARNGQLVDIIVDPVTGFTMLHSAAYNGRMGMVEYLLLNQANEWVKTEKGFTAAHIAAMRGHKECMEYILEFSTLEQSLVNDKTNSGLTAHQILEGYASEVSNVATFLLHENVSHSVLSELVTKNKVKLVLNDKLSTLKDCLNKGSLDHILPPGYINEHKNIWQQLKEESENFIQKLIDNDPRFKGTIINHYRNKNALELLLMDSYQIYLELDDYDYWQDENLHEALIKSGYKALQDYTVMSENLCLVPKVFEPTVLGANIFLSYCAQQITTRVSIHVIPVLKENLNLNTKGLQLSQIFNDTIAQTSVIHKAKTKLEKWSYVTFEIERLLFSKVDDNQLLVLSVCRFIKKILNPHWWFPRVESRRHGRQWRHYAVTLQSVSERLLISCFLGEIFKTPEEKWDNSYILDRVLGIFRQMAKQEKNGQMVAKCFLDPRGDEIKVSQNIPVIIDFLQEMRKFGVDNV